MLYSLGSQASIVDTNHAFHPYHNVVCGLSFSRSQPDFEGFLWALRFPPSSKLTPSLNPICRTLLITVLCTEGLSWINIWIIITEFNFLNIPKIFIFFYGRHVCLHRRRGLQRDALIILIQVQFQSLKIWIEFDALTVTNTEDHFVTANARIIKKSPFQIKRFEGNIFEVNNVKELFWEVTHGRKEE